MTEETAAAKVSVTVEKLKEWEEGNNQPTIRQAQTLAKAYKRPFALFFLPESPVIFNRFKTSGNLVQKSSQHHLYLLFEKFNRNKVG